MLGLQKCPAEALPGPVWPSLLLFLSDQHPQVRMASCLVGWGQAGGAVIRGALLVWWFQVLNPLWILEA